MMQGMSEQTASQAGPVNGQQPPVVPHVIPEEESPGTGEIILAVATIIIAIGLVLIAIDGLYPGSIFGFARSDEG
jgi:hypothetical protein